MQLMAKEPLLIGWPLVRSCIFSLPDHVVGARTYTHAHVCVRVCECVIWSICYCCSVTALFCFASRWIFLTPVRRLILMNGKPLFSEENFQCIIMRFQPIIISWINKNQTVLFCFPPTHPPATVKIVKILNVCLWKRPKRVYETVYILLSLSRLPLTSLVYKFLFQLFMFCHRKYRFVMIRSTCLAGSWCSWNNK